MRKVERNKITPPTSLTTSGELARARGYMADPEKAGRSFSFAAYRHADVKHRLELLFHGKCAYCETMYASSAPVDVEHFRPKGAPSGDNDHPGYWWLAMDWENLLPSCIDCNRLREQIILNGGSDSLAELWRSRKPANPESTTQAGKGRTFPISGTRAGAELRDFTAEGALLINPCDDEPSDHLEFRIFGDDSISLAVPAGGDSPSKRGATTIQAFGLNRLALVQERTKVIRRLEFLSDLIRELDRVARSLADPLTRAALRKTPARGADEVLQRVIKRAVEEMAAAAEPSQPYSAAAAAWIRSFAKRVGP
ncbi:hypothetical protein ACU8L5_25475 (plasmid) [Rhizobium leguminosarum]